MYRLALVLVGVGLVVGCSDNGTAGAGGTGTGGASGTATGDFSFAHVRASLGAIEIALRNAGGTCASRAQRKVAGRSGGVDIRLLAVSGGGPLQLSSAATLLDSNVYPGGPGALGAIDEFTAIAPPAYDEGAAPDFSTLPLANGVVVTLDAAPDYDTGAVAGSYDLQIDGVNYAGTFDAAFCPTDNTVLDSLAFDVWWECGLTPDIPYAPDSTGQNDSPSTFQRDLVRGFAAMGLFDDELACTRTTTDDYCKGGQPYPNEWDPNNVGECLVLEINGCFGGAGTASRPDICGL